MTTKKVGEGMEQDNGLLEHADKNISENSF